MTNNTKQKTINYYDPTTGRHVERTVDVPVPLPVKELPRTKTLPNGVTGVEEIGSLEALHDIWNDQAMHDLNTGTGAAGRGALAQALREVFSSPEEKAVINMLASSDQTSDDRALKLLARAMHHVKQARDEANSASYAQASAEHLYDIAQENIKHLKEQRAQSDKDFREVIEDRDALKRRLATALDQHDTFCEEAQAATREAVTDYENEVVKKMADLAKERNDMVAEVAALRDENSRLKGERNIQRSRIDRLERAIEAQGTTINQMEQKEHDMAQEQTERVDNQTTEEHLRCGDEVYCKVSGEGPFVLMTKVEEALVEYKNPISGSKNHFNCGRLTIDNAWLVRCKDNSMRTLPEPALTKQAPTRRMSLGGLKTAITSDVASRLAQAAVWVFLLYMLYMQRG